jgi:hypothetical protein
MDFEAENLASELVTVVSILFHLGESMEELEFFLLL